MDFSQNNFNGGLNQSVESTRIGDGQLWLLRNGRIRDGLVTPIKKPTLVQEGVNAQGIYSLGSQVILFMDGVAYYRDYLVPDSAFQKVANMPLQGTNVTPLDPNQEYIYAIGFPASTMNFKRASNALIANNGITLKDSITQAGAAVLMQDGINLPIILTTDGPRIVQQYNDWTIANPEYIPKGRNMIIYDEILYLLSPDGSKILRSVSGRPSNFMIPVTDPEGDKLESEVAGGADAVSHSISNAAITCLAEINSDVDAFYAATNDRSYFVQPDWENTLFAEPRFTNKKKADTGAANQFSFIEILGDHLYIDKSGIRSFNAAQNTKEAGKNFPFSRQVYKLFEMDENDLIQQDTTCAIRYNNYALLAVKTKFGYRVIVYDESHQNPDGTLGQFVSVDEWGVDGAAIKMFCEVRVGTIRKLLFITDDGRLFEAYSSDELETCGVYIGDYPNVNLHKVKPNTYVTPKGLLARFTNVRHDGLVYATPYVDSKIGTRKICYVKANDITSDFPSSFPNDNQETDKTKSATITWPGEKEGSDVGVLIEWNFDGQLMDTTLSCNDREMRVSSEQAAQVQQSFSSGLIEIKSTSMTDVVPTQNIVVTGTRLNKVTRVYLGLEECVFQAQGSTQLTIIIPAEMPVGSYLLTFVSSNLVTPGETINVTEQE